MPDPAQARVPPFEDLIVSAEDLSNIGPVALLQDSAAVAALGIDHAERNGHHYFAGLSMFAPDVQDLVLSRHGDLYRRHERGFAALAIKQGVISLRSVNRAPFGYEPALDPRLLARDLASPEATCHPHLP